MDRSAPDLTRPTLRGWFGMSASTHWLATGTAQSVLERDGTAFDAAVAAAFVLHVVEPHLNGAGGDLVALYATSADGVPRVLAGQGPAPAAASIEHFAAEGLDRVPGAGGLAAAVPGAVDAWLRLLAEHGTWELDDVLTYALGYAERGFPVAPKLAATIATVADLFTRHWPTSAAAWLPGGRPPRPGRMMTNPGYARTLRRLAAMATGGTSRTGRIEAARHGWRTEIAREAVAFVREPHRHSSGGDHAGVLDAGDWSGFRATVEAPVTAAFRGTTVVKAPGWTQGPVLLQMLTLLDHVGDDRLDLRTATGVHTVVEATKLAMADRDAYYGDTPDSAAAVSALLDPGYAPRRAGEIDEKASDRLRPGDIGRTAFHPRLWAEGGPESGDAPGTGEPTVDARGDTRGDTCHIDVVDRHGNLVSATPSGGWLQSSPTVPSLGFCLGSRLQMTWLDPASPSRLEPGRRPRTTLSPTMLVRDGVPVGALGTPGGDQQDQWQLLYLLRTLAQGYSPQAAVDAPMFHTNAFPSSFWPRSWEPAGLVVEDRVGPEVLDDLRARGHAVTVAGAWSLGRLSAVGRDPDTGELFAAANPRGALGYAAGR